MDLILGHRQQHLPRAAQLAKAGEDQMDGFLDPSIGIKSKANLAMPDVADWHADPQLATPRLGARGIEHPGTQYAELEFSRAMTSNFSSTMPPAVPKTRIGWAATVRISKLMPMEIRNTPTNRPLNGSMVTSTWRRYSVTASSSPPISAPRAMERPAAVVARPVAITTSRHAAMNNSGRRVRATLRNSGRSTKRPRANAKRRRRGSAADGADRAVGCQETVLDVGEYCSPNGRQGALAAFLIRYIWHIEATVG